MITLEQDNMIRTLVYAKNADEVLATILDVYGDTPERISKILGLISRLADKQVQLQDKKIQQYNFAVDLLVADRKQKQEKRRSKTEFTTLLYTCAVHMNVQEIEHQSIACKSFYNELVEAIKKCEGFDYKSSEDWEWLVNAAHCEDLVLQIIHKHIDANFVMPKVKRMLMNMVR